MTEGKGLLIGAAFPFFVVWMGQKSCHLAVLAILKVTETQYSSIYTWESIPPIRKRVI